MVPYSHFISRHAAPLEKTPDQADWTFSSSMDAVESAARHRQRLPDMPCPNAQLPLPFAISPCQSNTSTSATLATAEVHQMSRGLSRVCATSQGGITRPLASTGYPNHGFLPPAQENSAAKGQGGDANGSLRRGARHPTVCCASSDEERRVKGAKIAMGGTVYVTAPACGNCDLHDLYPSKCFR